MGPDLSWFSARPLQVHRCYSQVQQAEMIFELILKGKAGMTENSRYFYSVCVWNRFHSELTEKRNKSTEYVFYKDNKNLFHLNHN